MNGYYSIQNIILELIMIIILDTLHDQPDKHVQSQQNGELKTNIIKISAALEKALGGVHS